MTRLADLQVDRVVNLRFGSNTYFLARPGCPDCVVIDPGEGIGSWLAGRVVEHGGRLAYALLTHEHYDHISGLPAVKKQWGCQVVCSRECSVAIAEPSRNFSRYLIQRDVACGKADHCSEDLDWELDWSGGRFRFIPTPGHSMGSICIAIENLLFTGDCLLPNVKRVTNLPGGNKQALEKSLALLLDTFDSETQVYPGHGEPFALREAKVNAVAVARRVRVTAV